MRPLKNFNGNESNDQDTQETSNQDIITRRRKNVQMIANVRLIWLDNNIDAENLDCQNIIHKLQHVVHSIKTFTNGEESIQFLETIGDENVCMVVSGGLGQDIVPQLHHMPQVDTIFIFCAEKEYHQQWVQNWLKIKGVFTDIDLICDALKQAAQQYEQNSIPITFVETTGDMTNKNLDHLEPSFMYTQIMKEILLTIQFEERHFEEFIDYCFEALKDNPNQLQNVNKIKQKYGEETPIWWYTYECFLYPMLNRALRTLDTDLIVTLGFFIKDLHSQIDQLYKEQFDSVSSNESFAVYRGQGLTKEEFDKMMQTKGGLLSFNCFLSTSKKLEVSRRFAQRSATNPNLVGILFVMTIDPTQSTTPLAAISKVSYFRNQEEEILFSMHTVFRINDITPMDENQRLFQVNLTLTNDNDPDLRVLTDRIREETYPNEEGWYRLGITLLKMGQPKKADEVYEILLQHATTEKERARIYHQMGWAKEKQGENQEAIICYEKSNQIQEKILPPNHLSFAASYNNIGIVYCSIGEYSKALSSHEKALAIRQQSLPPNHLDLTYSYNNIGMVYSNMGEYSKALSSYEKTLAIKQQSLPPNHPDLAISYNNIGMVCYNTGDYSKAFSSYEKSLAIQQQSLPPNHPSLASSYNNIGLVYSNMGEYSKALSSYEKALAMRQQSLSANHPHLAESYNNIGSVYGETGEYSNALSFFEKSLAIQQQSLPPNHPHLAYSYNNIAEMQLQLGEFTTALSLLEKTLSILEKALPLNHPTFFDPYKNTGMAHEKLGDYLKAHSFYQRAIDIGERSLPPNHADLQKCRENLDRIKDKL